MPDHNVLEKIYKAGFKFLVPLTTEETYENVVDQAVELVDGYFGSLVIPENGEFKRVYTSSPTPYKSKVRKKAFVYKAFITGKPLIVNISRTKKAHPELTKLGIQSTIHIPLSYKGKAFGVLIVNSKKDKVFTQRELDILKLFGSMVSLAIRKTQLYDEIKKALALRDQFLSMVSHELKTPLTTINGYVQLLDLKFREKRSPEAKWIKELYWEADRLTRLIKKLLEVNRLKSGRTEYKLKEYRLLDLIQRVIFKFQTDYPNYKVTILNKLKTQNDRIIADMQQILVAIDSIFDNAGRYSSPDSTIKIVIKEEQTSFVFLVSDQGKGILENDIPHIFDPFFKGSNHNREGIGIGLFLAKNIIEGHQGTINVKSKINRGTTVQVKLPKNKYV